MLYFRCASEKSLQFRTVTVTLILHLYFLSFVALVSLINALYNTSIKVQEKGKSLEKNVSSSMMPYFSLLHKTCDKNIVLEVPNSKLICFLCLINGSSGPALLK